MIDLPLLPDEVRLDVGDSLVTDEKLAIEFELILRLSATIECGGEKIKRKCVQ
jgi:hypothetical protein